VSYQHSINESANIQMCCHPWRYGTLSLSQKSHADVADTPEEEGSSLRKTGSTPTGQSGKGTSGRSKEPPFTQLHLRTDTRNDTTPVLHTRRYLVSRINSSSYSSIIDHESRSDSSNGSRSCPATHGNRYLASPRIQADTVICSLFGYRCFSSLSRYGMSLDQLAFAKKLRALSLPEVKDGETPPIVEPLRPIVFPEQPEMELTRLLWVSLNCCR